MLDPVVVTAARTPQPISDLLADLTVIQADEILKLKRALNELVARHSGQPLKKVEKDTDRDHYMDAKEAVEYGLVDEIIHPAENAGGGKAG